MTSTMEEIHVEKYTREELESFVNGILDASKTMKKVYEDFAVKTIKEGMETDVDEVNIEIKDPILAVKTVKEGMEIEPPFYLVNLHGSLPLFDILTIINPSIDVDRAFYFPGSSRIQRSKDVLRYCFENFLLEKQDETGAKTPIFSLDEVVGGHSVERVINSYNSAVRRVARENLRGSERRKEDIEETAYDLKSQFPLFIFGIRDMRNLGRKLNQRYSILSNPNNAERIVYEFPVKRIITMDDPDYEVLKFQHPNTSGWTPEGGFYPKVGEFVEKRAYMDLLHDVARMIGADPEMVDPSRARVRIHCERYSKKPDIVNP